MKGILKNRENKIVVILFAITMIIAMLPLFSRYCINGHDLEYHLLRIESLKEGILIGKPFLKVNTLFFGNAGYASSMFYSDLFMYIPALMRAAGFSIKISYHVFVGIIFILCYLSTYYCSYKMTDNKIIASLAAIILTLSPYHMDDMLVRAACGEYMAFVFIPFAVYGIYNIIFEDMSRPFIFALGYGGLVLTHPATLVLNIIFAIGIFLIFIKTFIKKPVLIWKVIKTTVITMLVTSFYWLPMLEQMAVSRFYVSENYVDMLDSALNVTDIFSFAFPGAGSLLLIILIPRVFISKKDYPLLRYTDMMTLAGILFGLCSSNIFPWERIEKYVGFIQFPWRLLTMTTVLLSIAGAVSIVLFVKNLDEKWIQPVTVIVMAACIFIAINHSSENATGYYDYGDDYYSYAPFTASVIGGEWLPTTVEDRDTLVELSNHMITSDGRELEFTRNRAEIICDIPEGVESVNVPFVYYKGYAATLTKDDGSVVEINVSQEGINGLCLAKTDMASGRLRVWYKGTAISIIATVISLLTMAVLLFLYANRKGILKKTKNGANSVNILIIIALLSGVSVSLSACGAAEVEKIKNNQEVKDFLGDRDFGYLLNSDYLTNVLNPDDSNKETEEATQEEPVYVTYNICENGYELEEKYYAIKVDTQSGEAVYSVVPITEAEKNGSPVVRNSKIYSDTADLYFQELVNRYQDMSSSTSNVINDTNTYKKAIMNEADMLLFLEYYSDDSRADSIRKLAEIVAGVILNSPEPDNNDLKLLYNAAAVTAKAEYVLYDVDFSEELKILSEKLFDTAEELNEDDADSDINRVWAASELFRVTGSKTYRTIVETYEEIDNVTGFSYDNPGYYALFAYLTVNEKTDYSLSGRIMNNLFSRMNEQVKTEDVDILEECLKDNNYSEGKISEAYLERIAEELKLAVMINRISMSVEYVRYAKDRIIFLSGANPAGINYLDSEHIMNGEPILFALMGIRSK